jgi:glycosyltransferase involved in cell wall biosynthesis
VTPRTGAATRVALCHEWLSQRRGSEKTFEAMALALPSADLYALTMDRAVPWDFGGRSVQTTVLDRLGVLRDKRPLQLPLMPLAWRYASSKPYDVVVTSSHACAKGFGPGRRALHLCYCYTPMRYAWLAGVDERRRRGRATRAAERSMRWWDLRATAWVDEFAAISSAVRARIETFYGRRARVIHPPVDTDFFSPAPNGLRQGGFALVVSRLIPYKRIDTAIRACCQVGHPLVIAGGGPDEARLRELAAQLRAPVTFRTDLDDASLRQLYRDADVLLFCGEEDFGIVMVEAQACGTPVVALARGGSADIVAPDVSGVLVDDTDANAFALALKSVLDGHLDPAACRRQAERFSAARFGRELTEWVATAAASRHLDTAGIFSTPAA